MTTTFKETHATFTTPNGEIAINCDGSFLRVVNNGVETVNLHKGAKTVIPLFAHVHGAQTYIVCSVPFNILIGVISDQGVQFFTATKKEGESRTVYRGETSKTAEADEVLTANNVVLTGVIHDGGFEDLAPDDYCHHEVKVNNYGNGFQAGILMNEVLFTLVVAGTHAVFSVPQEQFDGNVIAMFLQDEGFFIATAYDIMHRGEPVNFFESIYDERTPQKRLFFPKFRVRILKMNADQVFETHTNLGGRFTGHLLFLELDEDGGVIDNPRANKCDFLEFDGQDWLTTVAINYETSTFSMTAGFEPDQ